jgi:dTDP-glucose 4,6-dehydratase
VSTDEVYGSLGPNDPPFGESTRYAPNSPYSASKAASDHLARAYFHTYGLPVVTTNCSNNYGPFQFPEKVIPLFVTNAIDEIPLPLYGDGKNIRDWLHVEDHCRALDLLIEKGINGEVYNVGGGNEVANVDLTHTILDLVGRPRTLIRPVQDRPGHDRRYALDTSKARSLGWTPRQDFAEGLRKTVEWYKANEWWWRPIKEEDPEFKAFHDAQYGRREP